MPLTTAQVAKILSRRESSVSRACRLGVIKATRFGHVYMIQPSDLRDYIIHNPRPSRVAHVNVHSLV
jgi:Helix-turn-helix domain